MELKKKKKKVVNKRLVISPSWNDGKKLLKFAKSNRDRLMMRLALYQALREGEICGSQDPRHGDLVPLALKHIDLERRVILVHGKGDTLNEQILDKVTFELLSKHIETFNKRKINDPETHLFYISTRHFQRLVKQSAIDAGLEYAERFSPHILRSISITHYNTITGNLSRAQRHARHKSWKTTMLYDRPDIDVRRKEESKVFDEEESSDPVSEEEEEKKS